MIFPHDLKKIDAIAKAAGLSSDQTIEALNAVNLQEAVELGKVYQKYFTAIAQLQLTAQRHRRPEPSMAQIVDNALFWYLNICTTGLELGKKAYIDFGKSIGLLDEVIKDTLRERNKLAKRKERARKGKNLSTVVKILKQ